MNKTCRVMVSGLVQGIGFRPFVAELAEELHLAGQVKNLGGIVEIFVSGDSQAVDLFIHRLNCVGNGVSHMPNSIQGESLDMEAWIDELPGCRIDSLEVETWKDDDQTDNHWNKKKDHDGTKVALEYSWNGTFHIVESGNSREIRRFLPVDLPTCDRCVAEMHDPNNRRFRYPFISCTSCGPRFSIQKSVPYDRETITMDDFPMCEACRQEYTEKGNIRRHAQTIACKECGPRLKFISLQRKTEEWEENGRENTIGSKIDNDAKKMKDFLQIFDEQQAISEAVHALKSGAIGAIKDIGGYHFAFSPFNLKAAKRLREFKNRDKKPFAVMFLNLDEIKEYCEVSEKEAAILTSSARPIVLLKKKKDFVPEICGESDRIGALLPCNPLQILLLEETGPLVMTSGNRGGEPIIVSEKEMSRHIGNGIDFMLMHDREILTPLDDSIYQVTEFKHVYPDAVDIHAEELKHMYTNAVDMQLLAVRKVSEEVVESKEAELFKEERKYIVQMIRRARGLAPEPIALHRKLPKDTFAAGGDLKAVFGLGRDELVYLSQYFGDLEDVRCMESREAGINRMIQLLEIHPELRVGDLHPSYFSAQNVEKKIQHHHAHVASVMAEHGLEGKVLGIACDGTGFGTDGTIWGSEFLLCEEAQMERVGHFSSVKLIGGDASAKQADLTLYSYMLEAKERGLDVEKFFLEQEKSCVDAKGNADEHIKQKLKLQEMAWKQNINTVRSSSMGRLFDAAAALLDICHFNSYEGECAILLEQMGHRGKCEAAQLLEQIEYCGKYSVAEIRQMSSIKKEHNKIKGLDSILKADCVKIDGKWQADSVKLLVDLYQLKSVYAKEVLAYLFHRAVAGAIVEIADKICKEQGTNQVALSGGTFINRILIQEVLSGLWQKGRDVYWNEKVPCGDGGLALGQIFLVSYECTE